MKKTHLFGTLPVNLFAAAFAMIALTACKKNSQPDPPQSFPNGLLSFTVNGQLVSTPLSTIATGQADTINILVADSLPVNSLTTHFSLASGATASVNNNIVTDGSSIDFTKPIIFTVTSADKKHTSSYTIIAQHSINYFGVLGPVTGAKSLDRNYNFYYDQFDGSQLQGINCGPAVSAMASKWADPTFAGTPLDARTKIYGNGKDWYTNDITNYLAMDSINTAIYPARNLDSIVKVGIDQNKAVILCLNMYYNILYNGTDFQHTQKFYQTLTSDWGHFLLVKGYKLTVAGMYLEVYDPYSQGRTYGDYLNEELNANQLKGKDRYYSTSEVQLSVAAWWPYVIMVAPKGQKATVSVQSFQPIKKVSDIPAGHGR